MKKLLITKRLTALLWALVLTLMPMSLMADNTPLSGKVINTGGGIGDQYGEKAFDGNINTKWCGDITSVTLPFVEVQLAEPSKLDYYYLYTGNDINYYEDETSVQQMRNPKEWKLYAKVNESDDWTLISHITDAGLPTTVSTRSENYKIDAAYQNIEYNYFRFEILGIELGNIYEVGEICLINCAHEYAEGSAICSNCGTIKEHDHSYVNGVCSQCNTPCSHEYAEGSAICNICGTIKEHDHSYVNGICSQCNTQCAHEYAEGRAICNICGEIKEHDHNYDENDFCTLCDASKYVIIQKGDNKVNISKREESFDTWNNDRLNSNYYDLLKFTATATEDIFFYSNGSKVDSYAMLFDSNMKPIWNCEQHYGRYYNDFGLAYMVKAGETYYLGVRDYNGNAIADLTISVVKNTRGDYGQDIFGKIQVGDRVYDLDNREAISQDIYKDPNQTVYSDYMNDEACVFVELYDLDYEGAGIEGAGIKYEGEYAKKHPVILYLSGNNKITITGDSNNDGISYGVAVPELIVLGEGSLEINIDNSRKKGVGILGSKVVSTSPYVANLLGIQTHYFSDFTGKITINNNAQDLSVGLYALTEGYLGGGEYVLNANGNTQANGLIGGTKLLVAESKVTVNCPYGNGVASSNGKFLDTYLEVNAAHAYKSLSEQAPSFESSQDDIKYVVKAGNDAQSAVIVSPETEALNDAKYMNVSISCEDMTTVQLYDNKNLTQLYEALGEQRTDNYNVQLMRTFAADGWYSLCLPFDVDATQTKAIFAQVAAYEDYIIDEEIENWLTFKFTTVNEIKAGKAYIVRVDKKLENPTFQGVNVPANITPEESMFRGVITPTVVIPRDEVPYLCIGTGTTVNPMNPGTLKAFRCYFDFFNTLLDNGELASKARFTVDDGEATSIQSLTEAEGYKLKAEGAYNLAGQKVDENYRGIVVKNGKKILKK